MNVRMLGIRFFVCNLEVLTIAKLDHQLNEEIRDKEIRLIGADGAQLGIVSAAAANAMAEEQGMDLVKISPNAVPPVCKIMDYSKFCYDQKKPGIGCIFSASIVLPAEPLPTWWPTGVK